MSRELGIQFVLTGSKHVVKAGGPSADNAGCAGVLLILRASHKTSAVTGLNPNTIVAVTGLNTNAVVQRVGSEEESKNRY